MDVRGILWSVGRFVEKFDGETLHIGGAGDVREECTRQRGVGGAEGGDMELRGTEATEGLFVCDVADTQLLGTTSLSALFCLKLHALRLFCERGLGSMGKQVW